MQAVRVVDVAQGCYCLLLYQRWSTRQQDAVGGDTHLELDKTLEEDLGLQDMGGQSLMLANLKDVRSATWSDRRKAC